MNDAEPTSPSPRLGSGAAAAMRAAIMLAGGREVCFVGTLDEDGRVSAARVVARGTSSSVLALPGVAQRGQLLIHNHPSGFLEPSDEDTAVAAQLHLDGVGFAITNNAVDDLYVVVEVPERPRYTPLDPEEIAAELTERGRVGAALREFEDRPSQQELALTIARLYNNGGTAVLEAGTGVGKSLAYLLPALRWSALNGERTVVSTNTINLQEQLIGTDLPFLEAALDDQKVDYALLKGWRNYLCLLRLEHAHAAAGSLLADDATNELEDLRHWANHTADGSLADLPAQPREEIWDEVAAESDLCRRQRCEHFDSCFVFKARRRAASADVLVVNHHLLLADVAVRRLQQNWSDAAVLPSFDHLIVDEAHHLEDAAAAHLGLSVSSRGFERLLNRLDRRGRGIVPALMQQLGSSRDMLSAASLDLVENRIAPSTARARQLADALFAILRTLLEAAPSPVMRLTAEFDGHPVWAIGLDAALSDLVSEVAVLSEALQTVRDRMQASSDEGDEGTPLMGELRAVIRRLSSAAEAMQYALRPPRGSAASVRWIEIRGRERTVSIAAVPLDLSTLLRDDLFGRTRSAVLTSATLAADGSFEFVKGRLGLAGTESGTVDRVFASPFLYQEQALLLVARDAPDPVADPDGHMQYTLAALSALVQSADGGVFVLCTSHRDVRAVASAMKSHMGGRPLLIHGAGDSRATLLQRFRDSGRAVLVGTASFWEGVDVRGSALRGLLFPRLPFKVPTEPLTAAHCEAIQAAGGDPFNEYMLPHATLRMKQGFGRLIRSSTDEGVVLITDSRVARKRYGETILEALPPARRILADWPDVQRELEHFYRTGAVPR